jgi:hypothetical protein
MYFPSLSPIMMHNKRHNCTDLDGGGEDRFLEGAGILLSTRVRE